MSDGINLDVIARLDERAATMVATRLKNDMIRAGAVSGEAYTRALNDAVSKYKFSADRITAELEKQFTSHGHRAAQSFGTGFGGQLARSLPGVSGFASALSGYEGAAAKTGAAAGRALGMAFTTAAGGLLGAAGYTMFKGFERYEAIDAARGRLTNLNKTLQATGKAGIDVQAVMDTVNKVVLDTPFALDKAFSVATRALASNTGDLKRFMTDVADASGFAGEGIDEIGDAFLKIANQGKVSMEEITNELRNIPILPWLQETMHVSGAQLAKMIHDNKVGLDDLLRTVEQHAPGFAKAAGDTVQGAVANLQTSVARTGANFLGAIFGKPTDQNNTMVEALKSLRLRLDDVGAWVSAHQNDIREFFKQGAAAAKEVGTALGKLGDTLHDNKDLAKQVGEAFLVWEGMKFTGLLGGLSNVSNALGRSGGKGGGSGLLGQVGMLAALLGEIGTLNNSGPDADNRLNALKMMGGGALMGAQAGGPAGAAVGTVVAGGLAMGQTLATLPWAPDYGNQPALPGTQPGTPFDPSMLLPGGGPAPASGAPPGLPGMMTPHGQPRPGPQPWTPGPGRAPLHWDPAKGWVDAQGNQPGASAPHGGPILPPSGAASDGQHHLPKAPAVPYDTTLPPGFDNLPMSSSLYGAESSFLDSRHKLAEKQARLAQLEHDGVATAQDVLDARNDVIEAQRDQQQSELRLYEARAEIFTKHNKQMKTWLSELGEIGAGLDQDFGISKGLAGIAENITKFVANLAAAPILGQLRASQIAAGFKPGEAGQGAVGMLAAQGAFGPQYQGPGSLAGDAASRTYYGMPAGPPTMGGTAQGLVAFAQAAHGGKYAAASDLANGLADCSGAVSDLVELVTQGRTSPARLFTTHNEGQVLQSLGAVPGFVPGNLNIGFSDAHTAATLPNGANFESGGSGGGVVYGGPVGALDRQFTQHWTLPLPGGGIPGTPGAAPSSFGGPDGLQVSPAGLGPGGAPQSPGPQPGSPGPGLPGLPGTSNPTRIGGPAPPQGTGPGFGGISGLPKAAATAAAGMFPGGGAAAETAIQLINRAIGFGGQAVGIGIQGLQETFLPAGSELAMNNWITKIAGGLAGAQPMLPNLAGQGDEIGNPTPEQVVGQGQGQDGNPAGLPKTADPGNVDNSKTVNSHVTVNGANIQNEQSMANTVAMNQLAMHA